MSVADAFVREIAGTILSKFLDPQPISFKAADDAGIGPVRGGCKKPPGMPHKFRSQLNRNAFLAGCHEFTVDAPVEHLIVGFGFQHGSTTVIDRMVHAVGTADAVNIPIAVATAIQEHVGQGHANEVLLFHNHPRNTINAVFDNQPLPSAADRATLVRFHQQFVVLGKALMGGGRIRFYVGENGFVQEFRTPDLLSLLEQFGCVSPELGIGSH